MTFLFFDSPDLFGAFALYKKEKGPAGDAGPMENEQTEKN